MSLTTLPRRVPFHLYLLALLDSPFAQFGWVFVAFGFPMMWVVGARSELVEFAQFAGHRVVATGTVTGTEATGNRYNEQPELAIAFTFTPAGAAAPVTGVSYGCQTAYDTGQQVSVEYRPDHPQYARIRGMRATQTPLWLMLLLFSFGMAPGLALILVKLIPGIRGLILLHTGLPAVATLKAVDRTNVKINHRWLYRLRFRFSAVNGQRYNMTHRTCALKPAWKYLYANTPGETELKPPPEFAQETARQFAQMLEPVVSKLRQFLPLEADPYAQAPPDPGEFDEVVLYHPANPQVAMLPSGIIAGVSVDQQGNLSGGSVGKAVAVCILPVLMLAAMVAMAVLIPPK